MNKKTVTLYMCGIDWQHEIGSAGDTRLYESIEDLKRAHPPVTDLSGGACGIVRLKAELEELNWPVAQDFSQIGRGPEEAN